MTLGKAGKSLAVAKIVGPQKQCIVTLSLRLHALQQGWSSLFIFFLTDTNSVQIQYVKLIKGIILVVYMYFTC